MRVLSVNSGIGKQSVSSLQTPHAVDVNALGLSGDEQADLSVHGGTDQALYLYPSEHYPVWNTLCEQAGRGHTSLAWGALGENLSTEGLLEQQLWVGDRLHIGECIFTVTRPRAPCHKLNAHLGFDWAAKMMWQSGFTGVYLAVVKTGHLKAGNTIHHTAGDRIVSVAELHTIRATKNRKRE